MLESLRDYCKQHDLLVAKERVLVGVSGGPDSIALLHGLHALADEFGITLCVAHLNHGFRGQAAEGDAEFVASLCSRLQIPCRVGYIDVPSLIRAHGGSPQAVARSARFKFFSEVAAALKCNSLALGHHLDDQAETILLNIIRGAGAEGLAVMLPKSVGLEGLQIIRPLLSHRRAEIESFLATLGQDYRIDSSNLTVDYSRNYIRHKVMPLLSQLNPKVAESMSRLASTVAWDEAYLQTEVSLLWDKLVITTPEGIAIEAEGLCNLSPAIASRVVRRACQEDYCLELSLKHVMAILGLCGKQTGKKIELPGDALALRTNTHVLIMRKDSTVPKQAQLPVPGVVQWSEVGTLSAELISDLSLNELNDGDKFAAYLNSDARSFVIRTRLPGDRYWPLGAPGTKKLKQAMSEAGIPAPLRALWPLVCHGQDILWVPGIRVSELCRVKDLTRVVRLSLARR